MARDPVIAPLRVPPGPLVVEFVGLPGAGKTTVAAAVLSHLKAQGRACGERRQPGRSVLARAAGYARAAAFHTREVRPAAAVALFALTVRPFTAGALQHAFRVCHWSYRMHRTCAEPHDLVILDQGVVQDTWSVVIGGKRWSQRAAESALRSVLGVAGPRRAFAYFTVDVATAVARIRRRPATTSRFDGMSDADITQLLTAHQSHLQRLFACALQATGAPCYWVDASRPPEENCRELLAFVDGLRGAAAPAASPS